MESRGGIECKEWRPVKRERERGEREAVGCGDSDGAWRLVG
jgi:hypothetical protein